MERDANSVMADPETARNMNSVDHVSKSRRLARATLALRACDLPAPVVEKVKIAFLDFLSCAFEARDLPWSRQAIHFACMEEAGSVPVIGTSHHASAPEAAFVNAVLGHGLVREDMHTAAVSHLGVVVFPVLVSLSGRGGVQGGDFIAGAVAGYEAGASLGRALIDGEIAKRFRPTGITGPIAGAVAAGRCLGLDEDAHVSAIGLAANCTSGLNEWAVAGGEDMFFHPGFAARSGITAALLASAGASGSESALDGASGLFAGYGRRDRLAAMVPFEGPDFEIMSVYHKPAPACNYAQTACQAALRLTAGEGFDIGAVKAVTVHASDAAIRYPGCDFAGPFTSLLQAKMSIIFSVAATLAHGRIAEENYRDLQDPLILKLAAMTEMEADLVFTAAYPRKQGARVSIRYADGRAFVAQLDDLVPAGPAHIRDRFRSAAQRALGADQTIALEQFVDQIDQKEGLSALGGLLSTHQRSTLHHG